MYRDEAKNPSKIFIDYKNAINTAVKYDNGSNIPEAINFYQRALEISNSITGQTQYYVASTLNLVEERNKSIQQRLKVLMDYQQQSFQNQNQQVYSQRPPKTYPQQKQQIHIEEPTKTDVPNQFQQNNLSNHFRFETPNQFQQKQYENPPKVEYHFQKSYENPPKTEIHNQYQQNQFEVPPKTDISNQFQQKQFDYPIITKIPNNFQQNKYENPPKAELTNQFQQNQFGYPLKIEPTDQYQPKQSEISQKADNTIPAKSEKLKKRNSQNTNRRKSSDQSQNIKNSNRNEMNEIRNKRHDSDSDQNQPITQLSKHNFDVIFKSNDSNIIEKYPDAIIKSKKSNRKNKKSSSPQATTTSPSTKISGNGVSLDNNFNDSNQNANNSSRISLKPKHGKRSKSTRTTRNSNENQILRPQHLLSNFIVQFDRYKINKAIGKGSFGIVSLVTDKEDGKQYAMKQIENTFFTPMDEQRLFREIELMSIAHHPLICHLRGFSVLPQNNSGRKPFIITDYYPNGSLGQVVSREKVFDSTQKIIVLYGIAHAMAYLHSINIVHRDLKPENVLLDGENRPIVCDFGLSKIMEMQTLRQTAAAGSPVYMAPELMRRETYSNSIDVYAYAYICYELLTETLAFNEISNIAYLVNTVCAKRRPPLNYFDEVALPKKFRKLIQLSWSDDPDERPSFKKIIELFDKGTLRIQGVDEPKFQNFAFSLPKL